MKYLLDSDTLIRSKNDAYRFDFCPGFWTWLDKESGAGQATNDDSRTLGRNQTLLINSPQDEAQRRGYLDVLRVPPHPLRAR